MEVNNIISNGNTMTTKRIEKYSGKKLKKPVMLKEDKFTQIPNAFVLNPKIEDPEFRLLSYIMSNADNYTIRTKECTEYLKKHRTNISTSFKKLETLGIAKFTDEYIEILIPGSMKVYKVGYLKGIENKPFDDASTHHQCSENTSSDDASTHKIPLETIEYDEVTDPIILYNTRETAPRPPKAGTGQTHSK